jgi:RecA/RadA recombinase
MTAKKAKGPSTLQLIAARLRKVSAEKEGTGIIEAVCSSDSIISEVKYVLRTDNAPWDDMTGAFPIGRVVEVFGLEASGKTALMLTTAYMATQGEVYKRIRIDEGNEYRYERLDPETYEVSVLYIDNEHSLDDSGVIEVNGHKVDIVVSRCETVEGIFKSIDETIGELQKVEAKSEKMQFLVVIVDTIAGTATKEELGQSWDKDDYSRRPKQLQEGFRNLIQSISRHNVVVICTNQVGDAFGYVAPKGPKSNTPDWRSFSPPGGKALKFWSSLRVFMWQCANNYKLVKDDKFQAGILVGFKTVKNRMLAPFREGRLVILFDRNGKGGLRPDFSLLESMVYFKLVEEDEERNIIFKLRSNGIAPSTFPDLIKILAETPPDQPDESPAEKGKKKKERYKDPRISCRAAWPKFYAEHKADMDALWAKAVEQSRTIGGIDGEPIEIEAVPVDGEGTTSDEEPGEDVPRRRRGGRNPLAELVGKV